jgi:hypothetical protein
MNSQAFNDNDTSMTHLSSGLMDEQIDYGVHLIDLLRTNAQIHAIKEMVFPGQPLDDVRRLAVQTASFDVFPHAIEQMWGTHIKDLALPLWEQWRSRPGLSRDRLRSLRRLIRLIDQIEKLFPESRVA